MQSEAFEHPMMKKFSSSGLQAKELRCRSFIFQRYLKLTYWRSSNHKKKQKNASYYYSCLIDHVKLQTWQAPEFLTFSDRGPEI